MSIASMTISSSVGQGGINRQGDVRTVQELINLNIGSIIPMAALVEDGLIGPKTINAITEFQRRVVKLSWPDGRVDPGGKTIRTLRAGADNSSAGLPAPTAPPTNAAPGTVTLNFKHGNQRPSAGNTNDLYESRVELSIRTGGDSGEFLSPVRTETRIFRGSIYPDNMSVKGRVRDGVYDLNLGFHRRSREITLDDGTTQKVAITPTPADLVAREQGFRPALIVAQDGVVGCISDNPSKTTSQLIHVHNGFRSARYSDGCQTIHPDDWMAFIQIFLDAFPSFSDWSSAANPYIGNRVGSLIITT